MFQTTSHTALHAGAVSPPALEPIMKNIWHGDGLTIHSTNAGSAGLFISATVNSPSVTSSSATSPSVTEPAQSATIARRMYETVAAILAGKRAVLVHERAFASVSFAHDLMMSRRQAFSLYGIHPDTPLSIIQGQPTWGEGFAGAFFHAIPASVARVETLTNDATPVGRCWSTASADYVMLQLSGDTKQASGVRAEGQQVPSHQAQTDGLFDVAAELLGERGFSFSDVTRTWFYIRDILQHYRTFNQVRDHKYARYGLMSKPPAPIWLPASTAIGGAPANGAALVADIFAVKTRNKIPAQRLSNPRQKEAFDYGASFARATLISERDVDLIQVSGTASIGEDGKTLHVGDGAAQIACTLDKLEALLETASARLDQVVTANIFVKDPALIEIFRKIAKERGLSDFPGVAVIADVCRDDLLFEIDAEVVVPKVGPTARPKIITASTAQKGEAR